MSNEPLFTYAAAMGSEIAAAATADPMDIDFDDARLRSEIAQCSRDLWGVPALRPRQMEAVATLLNPRTADHAIYVDGTGAGKSHAMRVLDSMLGGITLIFIPLLTLSADVLEKFKTENDSFGDVDVSHLDEIYDISRDHYKTVLSQLEAMQHSTNSTHFVFLSPQFLVQHNDARAVFIDAVKRRAVGIVVIDEVHLHIQHGTSFREEIRELRDVFFALFLRP